MPPWGCHTERGLLTTAGPEPAVAGVAWWGLRRPQRGCVWVGWARGLPALACPLGSSGVLGPGAADLCQHLAWGETGREVVLWEVSHQS